ncbi:MAG: AraC family transcriptional regulator [Mycobacterium sp.]|nr:MAG: AraC family transcriptional regulator [Mycobacterium sp.]
MFIGVMALPGCWASGLVTITDVIRGANTARQQVATDIAEIELATVGIDYTPVPAAGGLMVPIDLTVDDAAMSRLDLLVVPALTMNTPAGVVDALMRDEVQAARAAVRDWVRSDRPVAAACTGTFVLADAGVLDEHQATTSWWLADEFARRFPRVRLDMSRMVIADGSVTTAGAAFAHIDLAMHIVAGISPQLADATAAILLVDRRPASSTAAAQTYLATTDRLVVDFEAWIRRNVDGNVDIASAALDLGTTRRTLERRVRQSLGVTPYALLQRVRVEHARHLRQTTSLRLEQIALMVGYNSASALRQAMRRE